MLLTFRTGQEALAAVADSTSRNVGGEQLLVALQTPDWCRCVEHEFSLIRSSTAETYAATSNSLLGEDFSIPSMSFDDMDGYYVSTIFRTKVVPNLCPMHPFNCVSEYRSLPPLQDCLAQNMHSISYGHYMYNKRHIICD